LPAVAVGALAQPPAVPYPPDKPAFDRKVGIDDPSAERARLQADLLLLLKRISASPTPSTYPPSGVPYPRPKTDSATGSKSVDAIREGMNYFRDSDFDAARRTFQLIDPTLLGREDRAFVRYMLACSLRRQNRPTDAEVIYREVANSQDDEFYANCAIWQISLIKSEQDLRVQLEQLRSRAKSK
jgi:hypothetical protein